MNYNKEKRSLNSDGHNSTYINDQLSPKIIEHNKPSDMCRCTT